MFLQNFIYQTLESDKIELVEIVIELLVQSDSLISRDVRILNLNQTKLKSFNFLERDEAIESRVVFKVV